MAAKWGYLGALARIVVQFIAQIALARLLGPEVFGLFAAAFVLVSISGLIVEMGLGSALVQKRNLDERDVRFAFTWILAIALLVSSLVYAAADDVGEFFGDDRISEVVRGLTPVIVLQAFAVVPTALLKRELAFRELQVAQVASTIIGYVGIGVVAALLGAGVWSLVVAWIASTAIGFILIFRRRPHSIRPLFVEHRGTLFGAFGVKVLMTNIINWLIENIDNVMIGRILGPSSLGIYTVSYSLVRNPANHFMATLQSVLFPVTSLVQDDVPRLGRAYLTVVSAVSLISFPVFASVSAVSQTVVEGLLGAKWTGAAAVITPLAISMLAHTAMTGSVILLSINRAERELQVQAVVLIVLVPAIAVAASSSVSAVAWAVAGVYVLRAAALIGAIVISLGMTWRQIIGALRGGTALSVIVASSVWGLDHCLRNFGQGGQLRLAADVLVGSLVWAGALYAFRHSLMSDGVLELSRKIMKKPLWPRIRRG